MAGFAAINHLRFGNVDLLNLVIEIFQLSFDALNLRGRKIGQMFLQVSIAFLRRFVRRFVDLDESGEQRCFLILQLIEPRFQVVKLELLLFGLTAPIHRKVNFHDFVLQFLNVLAARLLGAFA